MTPAMVQLSEVTKRFGAFTAVDHVSLNVRSGEFVTLLGPSGCGKTTLLRMLSGFENPSEGVIRIAGKDVTHLPPYRRDVNQVFQSYALFPHLTVEQNIAFGLRMQKVAPAEIERRVAAVVELIALKGFERRRPDQLSGGQRQRVALARAIVPEPQVLLLDEPLSALDVKLRRSMQLELKRLQRHLGLTTIFVTHDQEEAMILSDRIAVMRIGRIEQLGTVSEVYHRPKTRFVADFLGEANLLEVELRGQLDDGVRVQTKEGLELLIASEEGFQTSTRAVLSIRPEKIHLSKAPIQAENTFEAVVVEEIFQGAMDRLTLRLPGGGQLTALIPNSSALKEAIHQGDRVFCGLHRDDLVLIQSDELSE